MIYIFILIYISKIINSQILSYFYKVVNNINFKMLGNKGKQYFIYLASIDQPWIEKELTIFLKCKIEVYIYSDYKSSGL